MNETDQPHPLKGMLLALIAFAIFAGHDVVVKLLGAQYSPVQIIFFSVLFGFPTIIIALLRDRTGDNLRPKHPWWSLLRTCTTVLTAGCVFYAFSVLPLAETYAILFATPLIITLLSVPMLGERLHLRRIIAVLAGLGGVLVVLDPGQTTLSAGHFAGLAAAAGGSLAAIIVRKIGPDERPVVLILYPMVANFLIMGAALPFVYKPMPIEHLGLSASMALLAAIAGYLVILAYRSSEAVLVAPTQYSQIIWATGFGVLFFDERPGTNVLLGAGIIILSGIYILWRESRAGASAKMPLLKGFYNRFQTGTSLRTGLLLRNRDRG